jgi:hypothetical protein
MATLTNREYGDLRDRIYSRGAGKEELQGLAGGLPSEPQLRAAFQALENRWDNARPQIKTDIETALGRQLEPTVLRQITVAWMRSKLDRGG